MTDYKEEQKMYDELMDVLSSAFIYEIPLDKLKEVERVYNSREWTEDHSWMIESTLKGRLKWAVKRENEKLVKVSSNVLTEISNSIGTLHMN